MLYKELYKESNELAKERFVLVRERVAEIEEKPETEKDVIRHYIKTFLVRHIRQVMRIRIMLWNN